jgi:hypothetical protein
LIVLSNHDVLDLQRKCVQNIWPSLKLKTLNVFSNFRETQNSQISDPTKSEAIIKFQKRAHNPLLIAAGFDEIYFKIPWLEKKAKFFVGLGVRGINSKN